MDRTAEELLARAKRFAHRVTYDELVAEGMAALEGAGFDRDQIEKVAGMVGSTADELAHSMATASPCGHEGVKGVHSKDDQRLLTELRQVIERHAAETSQKHPGQEGRVICIDAELKPAWCSARRELLLGDKLIKQFRQPARNQEQVLNTFEEDGWPERIDDPLPRTPGIEPKRRLRDTVAALNQNHKTAGLIMFESDGTGEGVLWKLLRGRQ